MGHDVHTRHNSDEILILLSDLDDLLDRERMTLLEGDIDGMTRSLREKERLIDALSDLDLTRDADLGKIQVKVLRNQKLLDSALEGIRSVANRISTLRRIRDTLETYDQSGRKTTIAGMSGGQIEKRA
jgi:hypothetical protein